MRRRRKIAVIIITLVCVSGVFIGGVFAGRARDVPFVGQEEDWSIGIYTGTDPFSLAPANGVRNPVLSAHDVTDVRARLVGDPFMVEENGTWYMFFEVLNRRTKIGNIGVATSGDGLHWTYQHIVLQEPWALSYPCVFKWMDSYYMVCESSDVYCVHLYKANAFPGDWVLVSTLLDRGDYVDPTIFRYNDKWWMFVANRDDDILRLSIATI